MERKEQQFFLVIRRLESVLSQRRFLAQTTDRQPKDRMLLLFVGHFLQSLICKKIRKNLYFPFSEWIPFFLNVSCRIHIVSKK